MEERIRLVLEILGPVAQRAEGVNATVLFSVPRAGLPDGTVRWPLALLNVPAEDQVRTVAQGIRVQADNESGPYLVDVVPHAVFDITWRRRTERGE